MRPILHSHLLAAALAAEEQERVASEEAEKRLKAALAAKRDPSIANSRIASPAVGEVSSSSEAPALVEPNKSSTQAEATKSSADDVVMENGDSQVSSSSSAPEVSTGQLNASHAGITSHMVVQGPWVPEMRALFEDVKKIAPKAAYDVIGSVLHTHKVLTTWASPIAHVSVSCLGRVSTSRSGSYPRMTSLRPPADTKRKERRCVRSVAKRTLNTTWRTVLPTGRSARVHRPTVDVETDTRSSLRRLRRNSRRRQHREDTRSRDWGRKRHIGFRMARKRRHWHLLSSSTAFSRAACCRPWTRTTVPKS